MRNSIKQLCRTPFKMIAFFVLITASAVLLMVGFGLWMRTTQQLNETESVFTTIGTVTQIETQMKTESQWDAGLKEYINSAYPVYDSFVPVSALQFEGANYLQGPEKRPYYGAHLGDYKGKIDSFKAANYYFFVEFSPVEDCIPTEPVLVNIKRVLSGDAHGSEQFWFCDHYTENPAPLEAGKTYIAGLWNQDNAHPEVQIPSGLEFTTWLTSWSSQTDTSGVKLKSEMDMPEGVRWEEVTENFYKTERGKGWLSAAKNETQIVQTFPVLPTESCSLLPAFHEKEATVTEGREITPEEFQKGTAVCMVTQEFAKNNDLQLGDRLTLPLYFANHTVSPGYTFGYNQSGINFSLANARGEPYPVFWEGDYEIVGIYNYNAVSSAPYGSSEMGMDMVIIPTKSVQASDENNIVDFGPMLASTTSFQIPNGSIAEFDAAFQKSPASKLLRITYDDNGYEQVAGSLQQTRSIATLLCAVGLLSAVVIILLLLYFFIIKQKKRTAIERSLGMSRRQCRVSLIGGIMVLTIAATLTGSIIGMIVANRMDAIGAESESTYSTEFSSWVAEEVSEELTGSLAETGVAALPLALGVFAFLVLFTGSLSLILINRNLKIEPILLLSLRGE